MTGDHSRKPLRGFGEFGEPPVTLAMPAKPQSGLRGIREVSRKRFAFRRERELAMRGRVSPRHVANSPKPRSGLRLWPLTREKTGRQVAALRAVLGTLRGLAK